MNLYYKKLLQLDILHNYYRDGKCRDFYIVPVPSSAGLIRQKNFIVKSHGYGIKIFYRAYNDEGSPYVPFGNITLTFALLLERPSMVNYTSLNEGTKEYKGGNVIYFNNNIPSQRTLGMKIIDLLKPPVFTYVFPFQASASGSVGTLRVQNLHNSDVFTPATINATAQSNRDMSAPLNFRSKGNGPFKLIASGAGVTKEEWVYIDESILSMHPFALVEVNLSEGTIYDYDVQLNSKETIWSYYLINKSGLDLAEFEMLVKDTSRPNSAPFYPGGTSVYKPIAFTEGQDVVPENRVNGMDTLVLRSLDVIPFFEDPKQGLQVHKKEKAGDVMVPYIKNLPCPSVLVTPGKINMAIGEQEESRIYVYV